MREPYVQADGDALAYFSPYNPALVAELKARIPATDRKWDGARKAWRVAPDHADTLADLTLTHTGCKLLIPAVTVTPVNTVEMFEVRYIGATKERGSAERSAFGCTLPGKVWNVVFTESVLRAWFDAPAHPSEASTLYQTLTLKETATTDEIRKAHRRLARQWHPDVCHEPDATQVFQRIQRAYEILSDEASRAQYDAGLYFARLAATASTSGYVAPVDTYRPPLRCGYLLVEGAWRVGNFGVSKIIAWEDITNGILTLVTSWPAGADTYQEEWL